MNTPIVGHLLFIAALNVPLAAQGASKNNLASLVAAERGFARTSVERGVREAFLANLAADAIVFRPDPVNGQVAYGSQPDGSLYLNWEPVFAEASAAGDLGYTTGPYEARPRGPSDTTVSHGHYVTVWRRASGGAWKAVLDIGTPHARPPALPLTTRAPGNAPGDATRARALVVRADSSLGAAGTAGALVPLLAEDARLHRVGSLPLIGAAAVRRALEQSPAPFRSTPLGGAAAASGDLGYTYGSYELMATGNDPAASPRGFYLRIWRRSNAGVWQVVLDLMSRG